jgi:hypothetical protein
MPTAAVLHKTGQVGLLQAGEPMANKYDIDDFWCSGPGRGTERDPNEPARPNEDRSSAGPDPDLDDDEEFEDEDDDLDEDADEEEDAVE